MAVHWLSARRIRSWDLCMLILCYSRPTSKSSVFCRSVHRSYITLPRALEEEPHNQNLQTSHAHHHDHLDQAEVEDSLLRAPDRAEVSVLAGSKVFLHPGNSG